MFTAASIGKPFTGRFGSAGSVIESPYAEIAWFCVQATNQPISGTTLYNLHRRQVLVMHYVGAGDFHGTNTLPNAFPTTYADLGEVQADYELSLRRVGDNAVPNGLSDLTKRENRFLHNYSGMISAAAFPYENEFLTNLDNDGPLGGTRAGEDIVLTNVIGFDVRVYDPTAEMKDSTVGGVAVSPGDPGYAAATSFSPDAVFGCYVDIASTGAGVFAGGNKDARSQLSGNVYDTWSTHYEVNGVDEDYDVDYDQDGFPETWRTGVDQNVNGVDDDVNGIVDDEQETSPPYPYPLRGIEVRIRVYEPKSRQVRQVTVRHTFVPH